MAESLDTNKSITFFLSDALNKNSHKPSQLNGILTSSLGFFLFIFSYELIKVISSLSIVLTM